MKVPFLSSATFFGSFLPLLCPCLPFCFVPIYLSFVPVYHILVFMYHFCFLVSDYRFLMSTTFWTKDTTSMPLFLLYLQRFSPRPPLFVPYWPLSCSRFWSRAIHELFLRLFSKGEEENGEVGGAVGGAVALCKLMEQKDTPEGLVDAACGSPCEAGHPGLCK